MSVTANQTVIDDRFAFGKNWSTFLAELDEERIRSAEQSLRGMLGASDLTGRRFLDVGSGSGLFSLAARRLGAAVVSFDYDDASVDCTRRVRALYFPDDPHWQVSWGNVLDTEYLSTLGQFDIVYAWGVLHHTGDMWRALHNVAPLVAPAGRLFLSIYNDQGLASRVWRAIKRRYNRAGNAERRLILLAVSAYFKLLAAAALVLHGQNPLPALISRPDRRPRGMAARTDLVDWVGGYPFEVAAPDDIFSFFTERGFILRRLGTSRGGHGCNEFVFERA